MDKAQAEEIKRHLVSASKIIRAAIKDCERENIHPAALSQVLGEYGVQLMLTNFGPDAANKYARTLSEYTVQAARRFKVNQDASSE